MVSHQDELQQCYYVIRITYASFLKSSKWDSQFRFFTARDGPSALPYYESPLQNDANTQSTWSWISEKQIGPFLVVGQLQVGTHCRSVGGWLRLAVNLARRSHLCQGCWSPGFMPIRKMASEGHELASPLRCGRKSPLYLTHTPAADCPRLTISIMLGLPRIATNLRPIYELKILNFLDPWAVVILLSSDRKLAFTSIS